MAILNGELHKLPALGVGITYSSALVPLLEEYPDLFDILEVEPQTTWIETHSEGAPYRISQASLHHISQMPGRKIVHSIGTPVGGHGQTKPGTARFAKGNHRLFRFPLVQ